MVTRNDITGDKLISRGLSKEGEDNWDRIFGKKQRQANLDLLHKIGGGDDKVAETNAPSDQPVEPAQMDLFDEERMDTIGQNGPIGYGEEVNE